MRAKYSQSGRVLADVAAYLTSLGEFGETCACRSNEPNGGGPYRSFLLTISHFPQQTPCAPCQPRLLLPPPWSSIAAAAPGGPLSAIVPPALMAPLAAELTGSSARCSALANSGPGSSS